VIEEFKQHEQVLKKLRVELKERSKIEVDMEFMHEMKEKKKLEQWIAMLMGQMLRGDKAQTDCD
jgi:hypothetical protein